MSDHISGPRALSDPIADITDVYAFPSPERPGHLVLVMNTLPFAKPWDALSEGLIYRFRLRPLSPGAPGDAVPFPAGDDELVVDCVFSPHAHPNGPRTFEQEGRCTTPGGRGRHLPGQRSGGRRRSRCPGLRGRALGSVHHGRARRVEDDRDAEAGVHRPVLDLPRRQGRAQPRGGARQRAPGRRGAGGRRRRDAHPRRVQRADRARRSPGGQEHDVGPEAVRPGQPRPRDPRSLQQRERLRPGGRLPRRLPGPAERQPRLLGRPRREDRLGAARATAAIR